MLLMWKEIPGAMGKRPTNEGTAAAEAQLPQTAKAEQIRAGVVRAICGCREAAPAVARSERA